MNYKTLLLPAALALGSQAHARVGFGLDVAVPLPLFFPAPGYYYPSPVYAQGVAYDAAPGSRPEQVTPAPGPGYVWMAGHWNNVSQRWVWVAGHWEMPPSPSAIWAAGHWVRGSSGWVWVDGAWMIAPSAAQPPVAPNAPAMSETQAPDPQPAPPSAAAVPAPSAPAPEMPEGMEVENDPPAPIVEYVPVAPYPDYVWLGGFWGWSAGWVWHAGHYAPRPFRGAAWVSGGWARGSRGWAWHGGRWR